MFQTKNLLSLALSLGAASLLACPAAEYEGDVAGECADGADNDQDGAWDCNDPDCAGAPECAGDDDDDTGHGDDDDTGHGDDDDAGHGDDDDAGHGDDDDAGHGDDDDNGGHGDDDDTSGGH